MKPGHSTTAVRRGGAALTWFRLRNFRKQRFSCPLCGYHGPFMDHTAETGLRRHARCPACRSLERHRLQYLVLERVLAGREPPRVLHVAPEPFLADYLRSRARTYSSADLVMGGVDHVVDLRAMPFAASSFDLVFASHVLEHIAEDDSALAGIRRIIAPGGIAVLPVPLVAERTVEYPAPNPHESGHVRAPGPDYFDRYLRHFSRVEQFRSDQLPECFQLFLHEDRSRWPLPGSPLLQPIPGDRHVDIVPVCHV